MVRLVDMHVGQADRLVAEGLERLEYAALEARHPRLRSGVELLQHEKHVAVHVVGPVRGHHLGPLRHVHAQVPGKLGPGVESAEIREAHQLDGIWLGRENLEELVLVNRPILILVRPSEQLGSPPAGRHVTGLPECVHARAELGIVK
eukprot:scaffold2393_cov267-Pinguiococcus_pyrenoidosus.AAC.17